MRQGAQVPGVSEHGVSMRGGTGHEAVECGPTAPGSRRSHDSPASRCEDLRIAGLVPLSTVDWPGQLVATVFCQGCPWRCTYCHNQAILDLRTPGAVPVGQLEELLARRRGLLDGVVFSGGEATAQHALVPAVRRVRELGFGVGLHTGGAYPTRLASLLGMTVDGERVGERLLDWVGFDVKAAPRGYGQLVGRVHAWERTRTSLRLLVGSGVDHELRTTLTPALVTQLPELLETVAQMGGRRLVLQPVRTDGAAPAFARTLPPDWSRQFDEAVAGAEVIGARHGVEVVARAA